jgi:hypothetical protein
VGELDGADVGLLLGGVEGESLGDCDWVDGDDEGWNTTPTIPPVGVEEGESDVLVLGAAVISLK